MLSLAHRTWFIEIWCVSLACGCEKRLTLLSVSLPSIFFLHLRVFEMQKPENLLLGSDGHLKLVDFGIAKLIDHRGVHTYCGTAEYIAPEVLSECFYGKEFRHQCTLDVPLSCSVCVRSLYALPCVYVCQSRLVGCGMYPV